MATYRDKADFDQSTVEGSPQTNQATGGSVAITDTLKWKPEFQIFQGTYVTLKFAFEDRLISKLDNSGVADLDPGANVVNSPLGIGLATENRVKPQFDMTVKLGPGFNVKILNYAQDYAYLSLTSGYNKHMIELANETEFKVNINATDVLGLAPAKAYYFTTFDESITNKLTTVKVTVGPDIRTDGFDSSDLMKNNFTTTKKVLGGLAFRLRMPVDFNIQPTFFKDSDPTSQVTGSSTAFLKSVVFGPQLELYLNILGLVGMKDIDFGIAMNIKDTITVPYSSGLEETKTVATANKMGLYFSKTVEGHVFEIGLLGVVNTRDTYNTQKPLHASEAGPGGTPEVDYWAGSETANSRPHGSGTAGINAQFDFESAKRTVRFHFEYEGLTRIRAYDANSNAFTTGSTPTQWTNKIISYVSLLW
jgi:cellobiose-specific phosphotransferase system component IIB